MTELLKKPEITSMKTGEMSDASREYYLTLIKSENIQRSRDTGWTDIRRRITTPANRS